MLGKRVIIRGDKSGVFFGTLSKMDVYGGSTHIELSDCRRLWYWDGAASLHQLAKDGVRKPKACKFTVSVDKIVILDAIEIIECTKNAIESIEGVKEWKIS